MARRNARFGVFQRLRAAGARAGLIVLAAAIGVTIGLLLPQVAPTQPITGGYTATSSATDTLNALAVDGNQSSSGYDHRFLRFPHHRRRRQCWLRRTRRQCSPVISRTSPTNTPVPVVESAPQPDHYTLDHPFVRGRTTSAIKSESTMWWPLRKPWQSGARDGPPPNAMNSAFLTLAVDVANQEKVRLPPPAKLPPTPTTVAFVARQIGVKASTSSPSPPERTPSRASSTPARARPCLNE